MSSDDAMLTSVTDSNCQSDFLLIPGSEDSNGFAVGQTRSTASRLCGRFLSAIGANSKVDVASSVCTQQAPFIVGFVSDGDELTNTDAANMAAKNELSGIPGGIHGFMINYAQISC